MATKRWYVITSVEVCTDPGSPYGSPPEPPEYGRLYCEVEAPNRTAAKVKAWQTGGPAFGDWGADNRSQNKPPWHGLEAHLMEEADV